MRTPVRTWAEVPTWESWSTWLYREVMPYVSNHFDAGGLIATRLRGQTLAGDEVYVAASAEAAFAAQEKLPAIFVVPGDDEAVDLEDLYGEAQFSDQFWLIVIGVRNVENNKLGQAALDAAGVVVHQVLGLLQGFQPSVGHRPMRRVRSRRTIVYEAGKAVVTLQFATRIYREGSINDEES